MTGSSTIQPRLQGRDDFPWALVSGVINLNAGIIEKAISKFSSDFLRSGDSNVIIHSINFRSSENLSGPPCFLLKERVWSCYTEDDSSQDTFHRVSDTIGFGIFSSSLIVPPAVPSK